MLVLRLLAGYWLLWGVLGVLTAVTAVIIRRFRVETDVPSTTYLVANLAAGAAVSACWAAFAALLMNAAAADAPAWAAAILHMVGLLSSWIAFTVVSAVYSGTLYRYLNLVIAMAGYALFAAWPAAVRFAFDWLPRLF